MLTDLRHTATRFEGTRPTSRTYDSQRFKRLFPDRPFPQGDRHGLGPGAHTELMLDIVVFRED